MKYSRFFLIIAFIVGLEYTGISQSKFQAQSVDNQTINICDSSACIVLYYESGGCSLCFQVLLSYCDDYVKNHPNTQLVVMIRGYKYDILGMRMHTDYIKKTYPSVNLKLVYDIDDSKRKTYYKKYKISQIPSLFLINNANNKIKYIPFNKLFKKSDDIEISDYLKRQTF